jgi:hypothetical protein
MISSGRPKLLAVLVIFALCGLGIIPPWSSSGIYCDDSSIKFTFRGDTVSTYVLFLGMLLPAFIVVSTSHITLRDLLTQKYAQKKKSY